MAASTIAVHRARRSGLQTACAIVLCVLGGGESARAETAQLPVLETNQSYVEAVTQPSTLAIKDEMAVFAYVLGSLPERVKVYPTENYYYFRFAHNGVRYAGDIRLDVSDRDQGKVHFGYYEEMQEWKGEGGIDVDLVLDAARGVTVEKVEPLVYRISHAGKSVIFALNDLSQVRPPPGALGPDEKFLGPIFDESAIRFFLVYNSRLKIFHYILDETDKVAEDFRPARGADRILIGKRTGFAFYRDQRLDRKILVGAFAANSANNNYFDGPFDQMPDNFNHGEAVRDAIVASDPSAKGKIDQFGHFLEGDDRYAIHPYRLYRNDAELAIVQRCATSKTVPAASYYACFVFDEENAEGPTARPLAMIGRSGGTKSTGRRLRK